MPLVVAILALGLLGVSAFFSFPFLIKDPMMGVCLLLSLLGLVLASVVSVESRSFDDLEKEVQAFVAICFGVWGIGLAGLLVLFINHFN